MKIKTLLVGGLLAACFSVSAFAQYTTVSTSTNTTVTTADASIADNLDLNLVSSEFGKAKNLEDFERRINDPSRKVSNLDLNHDGKVDYLRVNERIEGDVHFIDIQAVIGKDKYQTVATIRVAKDSTVQVIGETSIYGSNYIIQPVYVVQPVFFSMFWGYGYSPWYSPWYWGYYPRYFYPWHILPHRLYRDNVNRYINQHNHYNRLKDNNGLNGRIPDRNIGDVRNKLPNEVQNIDRDNALNRIDTNVLNNRDRTMSFPNEGMRQQPIMPRMEGGAYMGGMGGGMMRRR